MSRLIMAAILMLSAFVATAREQQKVYDNQNKTNMENNTIRLTIKGGRAFTATLVDNSSTQALLEQLAEGDVKITLSLE